ncbi:type II toxin-antitoxin system RelE/ParE family toxin [Pseudomonas sp. S31]|uniref:type II toxin-antitoxin system RelE/ParE family toxin n=1 Tax=Pseudomonas sp. S31 TaxID=1564473 RepID=UPI001F2876F1|nr:type II toxin-antitoxin system RelE/ParE family toxin [Pseudomonas sp. S31]
MHIAVNNPRAAILLDESFREKSRRAAQTPRLYRSGRYPDTREIVVKSNYVMVYRIFAEHIEILRILHARQQWP